jgi:hypothetical protein
MEQRAEAQRAEGSRRHTQTQPDDSRVEDLFFSNKSLPECRCGSVAKMAERGAEGEERPRWERPRAPAAQTTGIDPCFAQGLRRASYDKMTTDHRLQSADYTDYGKATTIPRNAG